MEIDERIESLVLLVERQNQRINDLEAAQSNGGLSSVETKIDRMLVHLEKQAQVQEERDELKRDLIPIANQVIRLSIDELAEIGEDFELEDLLFLMKRFLRDVHLIHGMLDRLESSVELLDESKLIGQQMFDQAVERLDQMEREGYFDFVKGGSYIVEKIVHEFSEEDIRLLGDNIVTILHTIRNLTQPEIMQLTNNAINAIQEEPATNASPSTWSVIKELSDPQVRKGMMRFLNILKAMSETPSIDTNSN